MESSASRQARQPSTGSLPESRPLSCGCGLLDKRKSGCGYSIRLSSGSSANTSASLAFPISARKSARTAARYARNGKWMYNGGCTLWFTRSARSTSSGRSPDPDRAIENEDCPYSVPGTWGRLSPQSVFRQSRWVLRR